MKNEIISPVDILCRELHRLDNDIDRLQMLVTLKSHLNNLQLTPDILQSFFSIFNDEQYRLQAIYQLIPSIYIFITSESLTKLLELFSNHENRLNLIETLKNCELLKPNKEVNEILLNKYRQYFHVQKPIPIPENPLPITSNVVKDVSNTSGVFEKARQFVCRVFGRGSSSNEELLTKGLNSIENDFQFQSTPMSLSTSQSYTSIITKSPPPSPITRQSSMSFHIDESQSMMVTQIHSILDNIDSVLDKIEAQTNSVNRRSNFNIDQITQTTINIVEHNLNMNDGSGDTTPEFIDLLNIIEESNSMISSDESEEIELI